MSNEHLCERIRRRERERVSERERGESQAIKGKKPWQLLDLHEVKHVKLSNDYDQD